MSETKNKNEASKPEFSIRSGSVQGAVWKNKTDDGKNEFLTMSLKRTYLKKDGDAEKPEDWNDTHSYRVTDVTDIELVTKECHKFIRVTSKIKE